jgi:hypothetical protein
VVHAHRRPGHRALAVVLATLLVPLIVGTAAAAPPGNRPAVTVGASVTGASVTVTADVNRGTDALASCTYVIDTGTAVLCGVDAVAAAKKVSRYTMALSNQAPGDHTVTVTVGLRDGGSGSGSATFTIAAPPPAVCPEGTDHAGEVIPEGETAETFCNDEVLPPARCPEGTDHAGEAIPEGETAETFCNEEVLPPARVFATAWTDLDGNHVYDGAIDSLVAKLVDTNGDNVLGGGDTIEIGSFPSDLAADSPRIAVGVMTHVVTGVLEATASLGVVTVNSGGDQFGWLDTDSLQGYDERTVTHDFARFQDVLFCGADFIQSSGVPPSQPVQTLLVQDLSASACTDAQFLDVTLNLP